MTLRCSISLFAAFFLAGEGVAFALDPTSHLRHAFGVDTAQVAESLKTHQFSSAPGKKPLEKLLAGDVLVFLDMGGRLPGEPLLPPVYRDALQGFNHAGITGRDLSGKLFRIDAPFSREDCSEFQGSLPYVAIRYKLQNRFSDSAKAADFAKKFQALTIGIRETGFHYDPFFKTDVREMTPRGKTDLFDKLTRYPAAGKPNLPDMYCSEVPYTIYHLLRIYFTHSVTGGELLDIGLKEEVKSGKAPAAVARDGAKGIIDFFSDHYVAYVEMYDRYIKEQGNSLAPEYLARLKEERANYAKVVKDLREQQKVLEGVFRRKLGLPSEYTEDLLTKVYRTLAYAFLRGQVIFRPVDLLKEATDPFGKFEVVGYYAGDMPPICR